MSFSDKPRIIDYAKFLLTCFPLSNEGYVTIDFDQGGRVYGGIFLSHIYKHAAYEGCPDLQQLLTIVRDILDAFVNDRIEYVITSEGQLVPELPDLHYPDSDWFVDSVFASINGFFQKQINKYPTV